MNDRTHGWMRTYGYMGLLPFALLCALSLGQPGNDGIWREAYDHYSAVILAFMGGIYWPICLRPGLPVNPGRLAGVSMVLALGAWLLLLLPPGLRELGFALLFCLIYLIDRFVLADYWPAAYLLMRGHLTAVVVFTQCLLLVKSVSGWFAGG